MLQSYLEAISDLASMDDMALNGPASIDAIREVERKLKIVFPEVLVQLYLQFDGQSVDAVPVFIGGYEFLPLSDLLVVHDQLGSVKSEDSSFFWQPNWVPFAQTIGGAVLCCVGGGEGQDESVLQFHSSDKTVTELAKSLEGYLALCISKLKQGHIFLNEEKLFFEECP